MERVEASWDESRGNCSPKEAAQVSGAGSRLSSLGFGDRMPAFLQGNWREPCGSCRPNPLSHERSATSSRMRRKNAVMADQVKLRWRHEGGKSLSAPIRS